MKVLTEVQSQALKELREAYENLKGNREKLVDWRAANGARLAELVTKGVLFRRIVNTIGCSKELVASAIKDAGFPQLLSRANLKLISSSQGGVNKEANLLEQLSKSYAEVKDQGIGVIRKWSRDNRRKLRKLRRISDKTPSELSNLIGCSTVVFRYDERKKWLQKKWRKSGKKTTTPRQPSGQPVPEKPQELTMEFWESLVKSGKAGDVMVMAQASLFRQLGEKDKDIANLKSQLAERTKERDDCREGWKEAEARAVQLRKEANELRGIKKHRDQLLLQNVNKYLVKSGEKSLNDQA